MSGDAQGEPAQNRDHLLVGLALLTCDTETRPNEGCIGDVTEEESHDEPYPDLGQNVTVSHVILGFDEREAEPDKRAVNNAVDDVVELVTHDEEKQDDGGPFRDFLDYPWKKTVRNGSR